MSWFEYLIMGAGFKHCFKIWVPLENVFKKKQLKIHDEHEVLFFNLRDK